MLSFALLIAVAPLALGFDRWIHPRGEEFDPERHYKSPVGELYYHFENDLTSAIGEIVVAGARKRIVTVGLGPELLQFAEDNKGTVRAVLLYDGNGDGSVDRTVVGVVEGERAIFDAPEISFGTTHWQIGMQYMAGENGDVELDRRYLGSVDSSHVQIAFRDGAGLADVGAGPPFAHGLTILKLRNPESFQLAEFVEQPERYLESFDTLTPHADADDWTADGTEGRLVTHFDERDVLLVRTVEGYDLDVEWGDVPLVAFLGDYLQVPTDGDGCYSSLQSALRNEDGTPADLPHMLLYCPESSFALFDAPDGYQIGVSALVGTRVHERTEIGTSIADNLRLYVREIYPRNPSHRETGSIGRNIRAGFSDAGQDLGQAFRHLVTGTRPRNIHTGEVRYRPSIVTALPVALGSLARREPRLALQQFFGGIESVHDGVADVVSAVNNTLVNSTLQVAIAGVGSTEAANTTGDYLGAASRSVVKNLPLGERFNDALSPFSFARHDRAFVPISYTRTDTQLNVDRVVAVLNLIAINAIRRHNDSSSSKNRDSGDDGSGGRARGSGGGGGGGGHAHHSHGHGAGHARHHVRPLGHNHDPH